MFTEFEYFGIWYLPNNPDNKVTGLLKYQIQDGIRLEIIGLLSSLEETITSAKADRLDIILGSTTEGKEITLLDCFSINSSFSTKGIPTVNYRVNFVIQNKLFKSADEINLKAILCSYNLFEDWTSITGINLDHNFPKNEIKVLYIKPQNIAFQINDELSGNIKFSTNKIGFKRFQKYFNIEQKAYLELISNKIKSLFDFLNYSKIFQNFLTLATYESIFPREIQLITSDYEKDIEESIGKPITVIFSPYYLTNDIVVDKINNKMLFTLKDISSELSKYLSNWFKNYEKFQPVFNLLFEVLYERHIFNENHFMMVIQGLETFHRRTKPIPEDIINKHNNKLTEILNLIPNKHRKWLSYKLKYSYEPFLAERIKSLFDEYSFPILNSLINDKEDFIKKVVDSRNYYTHYDISLESKALPVEKLYHVTEKLKILLISCLLHEIGFSKEIINTLYIRSNKFSNVIQSSDQL